MPRRSETVEYLVELMRPWAGLAYAAALRAAAKKKAPARKASAKPKGR